MSELTPEQIAEKEAAEKLAADQAAAAAAVKGKKVKVLLLIDCEHGKCGSVAELPAVDAKAAVKAGVADDSQAAVKFAEAQKA